MHYKTVVSLFCQLIINDVELCVHFPHKQCSILLLLLALLHHKLTSFDYWLQITVIAHLCIAVRQLLHHKLTRVHDVIPDTDFYIDGSMVLKCILDRSANQQLQLLNFCLLTTTK